jgi:hypothetical protein
VAQRRVILRRRGNGEREQQRGNIAAGHLVGAPGRGETEVR